MVPTKHPEIPKAVNNYKYKLGSCTFGTKEAKEAWILECVVMDITYILTHSKKQLGITEKQLLKISKRHLNTLIKQKRKVSLQQVKDYYTMGNLK